MGWKCSLKSAPSGTALSMCSPWYMEYHRPQQGSPPRNSSPSSLLSGEKKAIKRLFSASCSNKRLLRRADADQSKLLCQSEFRVRGRLESPQLDPRSNPWHE